jgi:hypothetical protein
MARRRVVPPTGNRGRLKEVLLNAKEVFLGKNLFSFHAIDKEGAML